MAPASSVRLATGLEPSADSRFRILAIDGGGIRGILPAVLLVRLEELLAQALRQAREDEARAWRERGIDVPRIADCFHLIAGTSTGGLLTAALTVADEGGRPKLTAAEALAIYVSRGPAIFSRPLVRRVLDPLGLLFPRYPLQQLREALAGPALFGDAQLADACTEVLIASYDTTHAAPRLFTRWGVPGAGDSDPGRPPLSMVDVALATAAAPTYFDPEPIDATHFVDGGVYAGNPTMAAIAMALRRSEQPVPREPADLLAVSLGTGSYERPLDYGWGGIVGWLRPRSDGEALLEAMLNGQTDHASEAAQMLLNGWTPPPGGAWWESTLPAALVGGGPRFWRYQPQLPEPWAMDDTSNIAALERLGEETAERYEDELRRLARALIAHGPV